MAGQIPLSRTFSPIRSCAAPSSGASLAKTFTMSQTPFETPGSTANSPELSFAQKMVAKLRSGGTQPVAVVNVGGPPAEGESSNTVPAGLRNLFAGGGGSGVRFGSGIVSSNLGSSWDATQHTIMGSVLDEDMTMGSASPLLGLSTLGNTAPNLSSGGTYCFILVDPRAVDPSICGGIIGGGGARFCSKDPDRCTAQSHRVKIWVKRIDMPKGFYILDQRKSQVYSEPCLLFEDYLRCDTNLTGVLEENYNLESCVTILKALEVNGKAKGVGEEREEEDDERRTRAVVAVAKTPKRSGMGARMLDGNELDYGQQGEEEVLESSGWDYDVIQIRGEIGKRTPHAPYLSLHSGIEYALECVQTLEGSVSSSLGAMEVVVNQAVASASAAVAKVDEIARAWNQQRMQGATDMSRLQSEVALLKSTIQSMETAIEESQEGMLLLADEVGGATSSGPRETAASEVTLEAFLKFKAEVAHDQATIRQDMKGGGIEMGPTVFANCEDCIQWAREYLPQEYVCHVFPSLTYGLCLQTGEVITKEEMQADEVHAERTKRTPMNSAVVLSVTTTIPPVLGGGKRDGSGGDHAHQLNNIRTYDDWMPRTGDGMKKKSNDGFIRSFERIRGAINMQLEGNREAKLVMMELHSEFLTFYRDIFVTEVSGFYLELVQARGSVEPHSKEIKTQCWALVTKLLHVIFTEIHEVRMFASELTNVQGDYARVNGLYLYSVLEELRVLREFKAMDYWRHDKYGSVMTMYLIETALPRSEFEARKDGPGLDQLRLNKMQGQIDSLVSKMNALGVPAGGGARRPAAGGGGRGAGVPAEGVLQIE